MSDHIKKLKNLKGNKFWQYILENKKEFTLILDNDDTIISLRGEEGHVSAPNYLGNSKGITDLLNALDIDNEHC